MDIFISYNWSIKEQVKELYKILTDNFKYKVWLDDNQLNASNSSLSGSLAEAINNSKVFISCITIDYCKSYNCNLEIEYASKANKKMIILMIDDINPIDITKIKVTGKVDQPSGIGFIITPCLRINCFNNHTNWPKKNKDEIQKSLINCLETQLTAEDYFNKGKNTTDLNQKLYCFGKAIELNPSNLDAHLCKGFVLINSKRNQEAIKILDKAIELNPNNSMAYNNKGLALIILKKHQEAIEFFDKAIESDPSNSKLYNNKGVAYNNLNKFKEAIECYDQAIKLEPNFKQAIKNKNVALKKIQNCTIS